MANADNGQIWDPLRHKEVAATPEEIVRQWFITVLRDEMGVPQHMMMSEAKLNLGRKVWRADILVYNRQAEPLVIVECKRPDVQLNNEVLQQAIRYNLVLNVKCIVITNGKSTIVAAQKNGKFEFLQKLPSYEEIISF